MTLSPPLSRSVEKLFVNPDLFGKRAPAQSKIDAAVVRRFRSGSAREAPGDEREPPGFPLIRFRCALLRLAPSGPPLVRLSRTAGTWPGGPPPQVGAGGRTGLSSACSR